MVLEVCVCPKSSRIFIWQISSFLLNKLFFVYFITNFTMYLVLCYQFSCKSWLIFDFGHYATTPFIFFFLLINLRQNVLQSLLSIIISIIWSFLYILFFLLFIDIYVSVFFFMVFRIFLKYLSLHWPIFILLLILGFSLILLFHFLIPLFSYLFYLFYFLHDIFKWVLFTSPLNS